MIKYYKLFDYLNRHDFNKTYLLEVISSKTLAKLSKGETVTTDTIDKICELLGCQPGDIMEYTEIVKDNVSGKYVEVADHLSANENAVIPPIADSINVYPI